MNQQLKFQEKASFSQNVLLDELANYSAFGEAMADWSLTSLQLKLIKIGARVVRHARAITFQLAEVAVTGPMVRAVLAAIRRLRTPPSCA